MKGGSEERGHNGTKPKATLLSFAARSDDISPSSVVHSRGLRELWTSRKSKDSLPNGVK